MDLFRHGRRRLTPFTLCFSVTVAAFSSLLTYGFFAQDDTCHSNTFETSEEHALGAASGLNSSSLLVAPANHFRDNLSNNTKYITSWVDVGWTNEAMTLGNLLYLALLTQRVPILPPFAPVHLSAAAPLAPFGEVFDVPRLSAALHTPILQWHELKTREEDTPWDSLGCWAIWPEVHKEGWKANEPRHGWAADLLKLDISYTKIPDWAATGHNDHAPFWKLARLGFEDGRRAAAHSTPLPSTQLGLRLPPDEQVLCYDFLYYVAADEVFEYEKDYSPAWHHVMKHARFTERVQNIAEDALRATFGLPTDAPIPPYIAIHARHGDFGERCEGNMRHPCFIPMAVWRRHVDAMRTQLRDTRSIDATRVIMTSDEADPGFWNEVRAQGWYQIDHAKLRTEQVHGLWYPVFIDVVLQSSASGFVGTDDSTMSLLAIRRVEDWHNGIGKVVKWNPRAEHPEGVLV